MDRPLHVERCAELAGGRGRVCGGHCSGRLRESLQDGGRKLRSARTLEQFTEDMKKWRFDRPGKVEWNNGNNALPANNGFKLMGDYTAEDGETFPVYMHFEGDAHVADEERNRAWDEKTTWTVLDYKSAEGLATRIGADREHRSIGFCWCVEFCS